MAVPNNQGTGCRAIRSGDNLGCLVRGRVGRIEERMRNETARDVHFVTQVVEDVSLIRTSGPGRMTLVLAPGRTPSDVMDAGEPCERLEARQAGATANQTHCIGVPIADEADDPGDSRFSKGILRCVQQSGCRSASASPRGYTQIDDLAQPDISFSISDIVP